MVNKTCLSCKKEISKSTYCSNKCQHDWQYVKYINDWKNGTNLKTKNISKYIKRYFLDKYNNKCSLCGWDKIHPITNKPPLEIDHIDGDSNNNTEKNLRLICPNCHALTINYKSLNKGKGRSWR